MRPEQKDTMQTEPNNFSGLPPLERAAALRVLLADRLAGDLASFVKKAWTIIHPSRPLIWSWHYDLLCECLTAVHQRKIKRLIINVPPRTAKSTIATICFRAGSGQAIPRKTSFRPAIAWICQQNTRSCAAVSCRAAGIAGCGATSSGWRAIGTKSRSS